MVKHFFRHALPSTWSYAMDSGCALFKLSFFSYLDSTVVGFHYTLKQYGGWVRPLQLRCQYSTVKCVIELHEILQMWFPSLINGGGSFPCNIDAIFIVFNISCYFVITLNFRYTYAYHEQPLVPKPCCFFTHEDRVLLLIFFVDSHAILSTHRVHGTSAAWCFCGSIVQWYTGPGVPLPPFPRPLKLLCCRCFLNFRRVHDLAFPCYWCEMLQDMGYPPHSWKHDFFSFSDTRFVIRAIYLPSLFQPQPR